MRCSLVIETWNLGREPARVGALLARLRPQLGGLAEVVVTHDGRLAAAPVRARLDALAGRAVVWVELPEGSDYYAHKNRGFDATSGEVVAFTDGDCRPSPRWLELLLAPIVAGEARVVAGATRYPRGGAARAGNVMDFPVFASPLARGAVRGFFANNVAFERALFAARRYPEIPGMFHGQCQVLALALQADGVVVRHAPEASVEHAWPEDARAFVEMRLLRGADTATFAPYLARAYAPRLERAVASLGPLPALVLLAARAVRAGVGELRRPSAAGVGMIAVATVVDTVGALASRRVYRRLSLVPPPRVGRG